MVGIYMSFDNLSSVGHGSNQQSSSISQTISETAEKSNLLNVATFGLGSIFSTSALGSLENCSLFKYADLSSMFKGFKLPVPSFLPPSKSSKGR